MVIVHDGRSYSDFLICLTFKVLNSLLSKCINWLDLILKSRIQLLEEGPTNDDEPSRTVGAANLDTSLSNKGQHQDEHDMFEKSVLKSFTKNKAFKTRHKLKAHTSKIVSSFKPPSMSCMLVKEFRVSTLDMFYIN